MVIEYQTAGRPVGSRTLVERGAVGASASTIRYELGRLEELGLLEHPHTSAGRVPTDLGLRVYVDQLMDADLDCVDRLPVAIDDSSSRIEEALRDTTQALTEATSLLALITAPRASGAVIRHVEVLQLQPTMVVVVCITAAGEVTRHVVQTHGPVDPGLVDWAGEYLNEQVTGMTLGQNLLRQRLLNPDLSPSERAMLSLLAPAFSDLVDAGQDVHIGGSPALINQLGSDVQQVINLVAVLDERTRLLDALRQLAPGSAGQGSGARRVAVRIGVENELPELRPLSVVGASYGMATRPLGMVGLIGPRSMHYPSAIVHVHAAAHSLSLLVEELYAQ